MKATNTIWVLVAGLAVGFLIGREMPRQGSDASQDKPSAAAGVKNGGPTEIPADWIKEDEVKAASDFAGMTPQQRYIALKVLNERPCDCGCPHGSVAKCAKEDPGCPRAPSVIREVAAMAKQGKSGEDILAAVKKPAAPPPQAAPTGPQKVELAAWTPIEGPKSAKVTIVEWSDFQ